MSTQRGNNSRTRAQKYKNRTVFKNDLYDKTDKQKKLNSMNVSAVCQHCKGVIEWKIKYKKYKPLSQPKTCTRCQQRKVNKAYHVLCRDCAIETRRCAKCLKTADEVNIEPPGPTPEEEQKLKVEMDRLIKAFPERKRRAFLRFMKKGKQQEEEESDDQNEEDEANKDKNNDTEGKEAAKSKPPRIPYTRDELLQKIEQLKLNADEDDSEDDSDDDSDDYDDSEEDGAEKSS